MLISHLGSIMAEKIHNEEAWMQKTTTQTNKKNNHNIKTDVKIWLQEPQQKHVFFKL